MKKKFLTIKKEIIFQQILNNFFRPIQSCISFKFNLKQKSIDELETKL